MSKKTAVEAAQDADTGLLLHVREPDGIFSAAAAAAEVHCEFTEWSQQCGLS